MEGEESERTKGRESWIILIRKDNKVLPNPKEKPGLIEHISSVRSKTMASTSMATVANALTAQRITPWPRETKDLGNVDIDLAESSSFNPEIQKRIICTDWAWARA